MNYLVFYIKPWEIRERLQPGNHTLFIGQVVAGEMYRNGSPLSTLDYEGVYLGKN